MQIIASRNILNLPVIIFGDINIEIYKFRESGLLQAYDLEIYELPGDRSTKYSNKKITYIIYSGQLRSIIKKCKVLKNEPFGPHYGYELRLGGTKNVQGTVLKVPRPLPFDIHQIKIEDYSQEDKTAIFRAAEQKASQLLNMQKERTGIAILGTPPPHVLVDRKISKEIKQTATAEGEKLAQAVLTSELFILKIAEIEDDKQRKYIGRCQFPDLRKGRTQTKGIPNWVSQDNTLRKVAILSNAIDTVAGKLKNHHMREQTK